MTLFESLILFVAVSLLAVPVMIAVIYGLNYIASAIFWVSDSIDRHRSPLRRK